MKQILFNVCVDFHQTETVTNEKEKSASARKLGCYLDKEEERDLKATYLKSAKMTARLCLNFCNEKYFKYAALQVTYK